MNENIRVNRGRKKILGGQIFKASIIHSILDPTNWYSAVYVSLKTTIYEWKFDTFS